MTSRNGFPMINPISSGSIVREIHRLPTLVATINGPLGNPRKFNWRTTGLFFSSIPDRRGVRPPKKTAAKRNLVNAAWRVALASIGIDGEISKSRHILEFCGHSFFQRFSSSKSSPFPRNSLFLCLRSNHPFFQWPPPQRQFSSNSSKPKQGC